MMVMMVMTVGCCGSHLSLGQAGHSGGGMYLDIQSRQLCDKQFTIPQEMTLTSF